MFYGEIVNACNETGGVRGGFIWIDLAPFICYKNNSYC
nr:MAG TPA: hypothetical protein [Caudoviricetes sp.]